MHGSSRNINQQTSENRYDLTYEIRNNIDAFRIVKATANSYNFDEFCLFSFQPNGTENTFANTLSLHAFQNVDLAKLDAEYDTHRCTIFSHMLDSMLPKEFHAGTDLQKSCPLFGELEFSQALALPIATPHCGRYGLVLLKRRPTEFLDFKSRALVHLQLIKVFQSYYENVLQDQLSAGLTDRELEIVQSTASGLTSIDIARKFGISEHVVNANIATILKKIGTVNRAHMVSIAIKSGVTK